MTPDFIPDIETLKKSVPVNQNFDVEALAPKARLVVEKHLKKWMGKNFYDDLLTNFNNETTTSDEDNVIEYIQHILSNWAMNLYVTHASVQVSDAGVLRREGEDFKSAYKYQENNLREDYLKTAYDWLEMMLVFLQDNELTYPVWVAEGAEYSRNQIINFAQDFNDYVKLHGGRWMFEQLRPLMKSVETFVAEASLGTDYYNELKGEILSNTLSVENKKVVDLLHPCIAYYTESEAILKGWARLTPEGLVLMDRDSMDGTSKRSSIPNPDSLDAIISKSRELANRHTNKMLDFLQDNITDYPTYKTFYDEQNPVEEETDDVLCENLCTGCVDTSGGEIVIF